MPTILKFIIVLVAIPVTAILLYALVRVIALAWFRTKHQFSKEEVENEKEKGREV